MVIDRKSLKSRYGAANLIGGRHGMRAIMRSGKGRSMGSRGMISASRAPSRGRR